MSCRALPSRLRRVVVPFLHSHHRVEKWFFPRRGFHTALSKLFPAAEFVPATPTKNVDAAALDKLLGTQLRGLVPPPKGGGEKSSSTSVCANPYFAVPLDQQTAGTKTTPAGAEVPPVLYPSSKRGIFSQTHSEEELDTVRTPERGDEIQLTRLPNGARVVSFDKLGHGASLGLFSKLGSRFELPHEQGCSHLLEVLSFRTTAHFSNFAMAKVLERLGARFQATVGRENILYKVDMLRDSLPLVLPMLISNYCYPSFMPEELEDGLHRVNEARMFLDQNPENCVVELMHQVAWDNQDLGAPLLGEDIDKMRQNILSYHARFRGPENVLLCGVNVDHDELVRLTQQSFDELAQGAPPAQTSRAESEVVGGRDDHVAGAIDAIGGTPVVDGKAKAEDVGDKIENMTHQQHIPASYTGGFRMVPSSMPPELCKSAHIALAWHLEGGWDSPDLIAATVLQSLLGGGGSFSTGGPGKGMHSRLFLKVLHQYYWVENCMAFSHVYSDSGIFGVYGMVAPDQANEFMKIIANVWLELDQLTEEEVTRAKNSLISSIFMNLETNSIFLEDLGRQILMNGRMVSAVEFARIVRTVTKEDLLRVAFKFIQTRPTVVHYGAMGTSSAGPAGRSGGGAIVYSEVEKLFGMVRGVMEKRLMG